MIWNFNWLITFLTSKWSADKVILLETKLQEWHLLKDKILVMMGMMMSCFAEWLTNEKLLRGKCPYLEFFWFVFSIIWTEYGEILRISPYNSKYGHFTRSGCSVFIPAETTVRNLHHCKSATRREQDLILCNSWS